MKFLSKEIKLFFKKNERKRMVTFWCKKNKRQENDTFIQMKDETVSSKEIKRLNRKIEIRDKTIKLSSKENFLKTIFYEASFHNFYKYYINS